MSCCCCGCHFTVLAAGAIMECAGGRQEPFPVEEEERSWSVHFLNQGLIDSGRLPSPRQQPSPVKGMNGISRTRKSRHWTNPKVVRVPQPKLRKYSNWRHYMDFDCFLYRSCFNLSCSAQPPAPISKLQSSKLQTEPSPPAPTSTLPRPRPRPRPKRAL